MLPDSQFGFRNIHSTINQVCHLVDKILFAALKEKLYCTGAFLNVSQAFDGVWHYQVSPPQQIKTSPS